MEIVQKEGMLVVGLPVTAGWKELWVDMPKVWQEFLGRHVAIRHRLGGPFIDVSMEKRGEEYLQLICVRVSRVPPVPVGMKAIEIPTQRYVHHRHQGPVTAIAESFGKIYDWAREHEQAIGEFKIDFGYTARGDELEHDLFVGMLPATPWRDVTPSS